MTPLSRGIISSGKLDAGGFNPTVTPVLWLDTSIRIYSDAGSTLAVNEDLIQEWHDFNNNGEEATQTTGAAKPVYKTNIQNGQPIARFTDAKQLDLTAIFGAGSAQHYFIALKWTETTGFNIAFALNNGLMLLLTDTGSYKDISFICDIDASGPGQNSVGFDSTEAMSSDFILLEITYNGGAVSTPGSYTARLNDVSKTVLASNAFGNQVYGDVVGTNASFFYSGDMGDIAVFDQVLTGSDRTEWVNHLMGKWIP